MNKTIFKYPLKDEALQVVPMPAGAKVLCAQQQRGILCLWAEIVPGNPIQDRRFEVFGTGHPMETPAGIHREFIGTVQLYGGDLVLHVYERSQAA